MNIDRSIHWARPKQNYPNTSTDRSLNWAGPNLMFRSHYDPSFMNVERYLINDHTTSYERATNALRTSTWTHTSFVISPPFVVQLYHGLQGKLPCTVELMTWHITGNITAELMIFNKVQFRNHQGNWTKSLLTRVLSDIWHNRSPENSGPNPRILLYK